MTDVSTESELTAIDEVVELVAKHATWAEQNRRLHPEVIDVLEDAGVFRMRTPKRYGGTEASAANLLDTSAALARAHGSTGWVASVYWIPTFMACMLSDDAQDEIFIQPDVRICGTLSPGGMAVGSGSDLILNGQWGFVSGALHADWMEVIAVRVDAGGEPEPFLALVPIAELQIVDDWNVYGLAGTGSVTVVAEQVRVPTHRVLPLGAVLTEQYASVANRDSAIYRNPLLPVAAASSVGVPLGIAQAAHDTFMRRLPDRQITYTAYQSQAEAPLTHLQVAEATLTLDEAQFHAQRLTSDVDSRGVSGTSWALSDRVRARVDMAATCRRSLETVEVLAGASGGSSVYRHVDIQRHRADLQAINLHALMNPSTNLELFGRIACGQEPNTMYL